MHLRIPKESQCDGSDRNDPRICREHNTAIRWQSVQGQSSVELAAFWHTRQHCVSAI